MHRLPVLKVVEQYKMLFRLFPTYSVGQRIYTPTEKMIKVCTDEGIYPFAKHAIECCHETESENVFLFSPTVESKLGPDSWINAIFANDLAEKRYSCVRFYKSELDEMHVTFHSMINTVIAEINYIFPFIGTEVENYSHSKVPYIDFTACLTNFKA
jgi:hypothetical protein